MLDPLNRARVARATIASAVECASAMELVRTLATAPPAGGWRLEPRAAFDAIVAGFRDGIASLRRHRPAAVPAFFLDVYYRAPADAERATEWFARL